MSPLTMMVSIHETKFPSHIPYSPNQALGGVMFGTILLDPLISPLRLGSRTLLILMRNSISMVRARKSKS